MHASSSSEERSSMPDVVELVRVAPEREIYTVIKCKSIKNKIEVKIL